MSGHRHIRDADELRKTVGVNFTDAQLAAITAPWDQPQAIIAGAGSGKTTVMAARVVWLIGHIGVDPEHILGLTFTKKAAGEFASRVRRNLSKLENVSGSETADTSEPTISTYHAFAGSLISEHGLRCGIESDLRVVANASRYQRAIRVINGYPGYLEHVSTHLPTLAPYTLRLGNQLAEHRVTTDELREHDSVLIRELESREIVRGGLTGSLKESVISTANQRIELSYLVDAYRQAKADDGVMDFSDQMAWGAQIAEVDEVAADLRTRFHAVLLDEYQDTSVAQRDLLMALFSGGSVHTGARTGHPVTAVGDPAQSIYGWRGASATNLVQFIDDFPAEANTNLFTLRETRRCAPEIIDVANRIAQDYYRTSEVVVPLQAAPTNPSGNITAALHADIDAEIAGLVEHVLACHREGTAWSQIGILVRNGSEIGELVTALRGAGVPVEVLGLTGLLWQPAVRDVLSVLELLHDVTANPATIRLLSGPRWRIGQRDLALLGRRAADLARGEHNRQDDHETDLQSRLDEAVAGVDPSETVSLLDAVEDPGPIPLSAEARERLGEFAGILTGLRAHIGEPLTELARRVIHVLGIDLELMVAGDRLAGDDLAAFIDVVANYSQQDRYASLAGLLAYLRAETDHDSGLDRAEISSADAVQVLTAHKAKGLEWDAVVLPFVCDGVFPSNRARPRWVTRGDEIPVALRGDAAGLADIADWTGKEQKAYEAATKDEALMEERRLAYVSVTRARRSLYVSGHRWGRIQTPRKLSPYLETVCDWLAENGLEPLCWAEEPDDDETNPLLENNTRIEWPAPLVGMELRERAAAEVRAWQQGTATAPPSDDDDTEGAASLTRIDEQLDVLLRDERSQRRIVQLPDTLSATQTMSLMKDEQAFAQNLARPMPRRPNQAARFGTRFHAWVEAHYSRPELFDPADLPGRSELDIADDDELAELTAKFAVGPFGQREPYAVEEPFSIVLAEQQIVGRIDAVYFDGDTYEVVDFKTNRRPDADPMQLAIYRLAWAELTDVDPSSVVAAFYYVRLDDVDYMTKLPGRADLERQLRQRD